MRSKRVDAVSKVPSKAIACSVNGSRFTVARPDANEFTWNGVITPDDF